MTRATAVSTGSATRRRPRRSVRIVAMLCIAVVTAAVAELAARAFTPPEMVGRSAVRHDPVLGRALIPGYRGNVTIPGVTYRLSVNSAGFRGPEPVGPVEGCVVFLGDSYTLGDGVDDGQEFPQVVSSLLPGVPVVNAGLAGEGQGRWIKVLERYAPAWKPRAVVLQVCSNDFRDNHEDGLYALTAEGALVEQPIPPESRLRRAQRTLELIPGLGSSRLYTLIKRATRSAVHGPPVPTDGGVGGAPKDSATETGPYDDLTIALVRRAISICRDRGWPIVGVTAQLAPGERLERIRAEFEGVGAPIIILPIKAADPSIHLERDDHWNPAGHRFVAEAVADALRSLGAPDRENERTP